MNVDFVEGVRVALRALRAHPLRSALTMLGIVVGVAAVVILAAAGNGMQEQVADAIRGLGTNILYLSPGAAKSGAARLAAGTEHTLTDEDVLAILRDVPGIQIASPLIARRQQVIARDRNWVATVTGSDSSYLSARAWSLSDGRMFSASEMQSAAKVAIIGQVIADNLFDGNPHMGDSIRVGRVPFTVIGVLDKKGGGLSESQDDVVLIPLSSARSRVVGPGQINSHALSLILLKLNDSADVFEIKTEVAELLHQRHRLRKDTPDDFTIVDPTAILATQNSTMEVLNVFVTLIASISLIVGGISLMNIMLVSVAERTREIGLRMAVGARRRDIARQFLVEAVVLALFGGIIGTVLGTLGALAVAWVTGFPVIISGSSVIYSCGVASVVGLIFGSYPAMFAGRLDPMIALRFE